MATIGIKVDANFTEASNEIKKFAGTSAAETKRITSNLKKIEKFQADKFIQKNKRIALSVRATRGATAALSTENRGLERKIQMLIRNGVDPMDDKLKLLRQEYSRTNKEMKKTKKRTVDLKAGFMAAAIVITGAFFAINGAVQTASNLQEQTSKFNTVFASSTQNMSTVVKDLTNDYAMSTREARQYLGATQDLLVPLGLLPNLASSLSSQVVKLAADIGSFNNQPTAQVMNDIKGALVGQFVPMKKYGVVINETVLKQEALRLKLWAGKGALTASAKAQAALNLVMKGSKAAMGDMARTAGSFANQQKLMKARFEDMTAAVGQAFLPIATEAIQVVSSLAGWFTNLDESTQKTIIAVGATGAAILVLTKIVVSFGVSFKAALGPITVFIGLTALIIDSLSNTGLSIKELTAENNKLRSSYMKLNNQSIQMKKSIDLTKELERTRKGSMRHMQIIKELNQLHPKLGAENQKTGGSFTDLARNIENANLAQKRLLQSLAKGLLEKQLTNIGKALTQSAKGGKVGKDYKALANETKLFFQTAKAAGMSFGDAMSKLSAGADINMGFLSMSMEKATQLGAKGFNKLLKETQKVGKGVFDTADKIIKPAAKKFKQFMTSAITPDTTKTGEYAKLLTEYATMLEGFRTDQQIHDEMMKIANQENFDIDIEILTEQLGQKKALQMLATAAKLKQAGDEGKALLLIKAATNKAIEKQDKKSFQRILSGTNQFFSDLAAVAKAGGAKSFRAYQALAVAQATIAGVQAAVNAWNAGMQIGGPLGPVFAAAFMGASIAKTAVQIASITKQKPPSMETGGNFVVPDNPRSSRVDTQSMRVNPGENVAVTPRGEGAGSITVNNYLDKSLLYSVVQEGINDGEITITNENIVSFA